MAYTSWRGVVGCVRPTMRPGPTEDLINILPEGIGIIPLHFDISDGSPEALTKTIPLYEERIADLAEQEVDIVHPESSAPFLYLGYDAERRLVRSWEKKFGIPTFTSAQNQVRALKAMKIKRLLLVQPGFNPAFTKAIGRYFAKTGLEVVAQAHPEGTDFASLEKISALDVYGVTKRAFVKNPKVDGILYLGGAMRIGSIVDRVEQDLGLPVVAALTARCWEIQRRLNVRQKIQGYGRLLAEMPDG